MPFHLGETVNGGAEWVTTNPLIFNTIKNPVATSLVITVIVLALVHYACNNEDGGPPRLTTVRLGVWIFITVAALVYLHYHALNKHLRKETENRGIRGVVSSINESAANCYKMGGDPLFTTNLPDNDSASEEEPTLEITPMVLPSKEN